MRLSEAIRLGALFVEETMDSYMTLSGELSGQLCGCALGTGAYAKGFRRQDIIYAGWRKDGRSLSYNFQVAFPEYSGEILSIVSGKHAMGMSRLAIADWLEAEIEPALFKDNEREEIVNAETLNVREVQSVEV